MLELPKRNINYKVTGISSCGPNEVEQGRKQRGRDYKHVCVLWQKVQRGFMSHQVWSSIVVVNCTRYSSALIHSALS